MRSGSTKQMLKVLIEIYPNEISKDELAEQTGYAPGSGGFLMSGVNGATFVF